MQIRSLRDAETLRATVVRVEAEITNRRRAITNNQVPNAGIARHHLEALVRANKHRKAILHMNRNEILAMQEAKMQFTPLRTSFLKPFNPAPNEQPSSLNRPSEQSSSTSRPIPPASRPSIFNPKPTSKQRKKQSRPIPDIVQPAPPRMIAPVITPGILQPNIPVVLPPKKVAAVADSIRQDSHMLAAEQAKAITKAKDAQRDMELIKQGRVKEVETRLKREQEERVRAQKKRILDNRSKLLNRTTRAASMAERKARSSASVLATNSIRKNRMQRARFQPMTRGSRGTGILPQLAVMMSLTDKRRAATVNQSTRTPSRTPQGPIRDQITEDVRQYKPVNQTRSTEYLNFVKEVQTAEKEGHKMIQAVLAGRAVMGFTIDLEVLGQQRTKYWASRAYALMAQVKRLVLDEAIRWDQGALNSGVAVSTDTRSQSKRKMTPNEFKEYLGRKLKPIIEPVFNEFEEELKRAYNTKGVQLGKAYNKVALGNSLPVNQQRSLGAIDKLRGHGRPVLSEQQGTRGLAGLFPALRSSMQGAMKR